jgi:hypothetical protein
MPSARCAGSPGAGRRSCMMQAAESAGTRYWLRTRDLGCVSRICWLPGRLATFRPRRDPDTRPASAARAVGLWRRLPGAATFVRCAHSALPPAEFAATRWVAKRPLRGPSLNPAQTPGLSNRGIIAGDGSPKTAGWLLCVMRSAHAPGTRHWLRTHELGCVIQLRWLPGRALRHSALDRIPTHAPRRLLGRLVGEAPFPPVRCAHRGLCQAPASRAEKMRGQDALATCLAAGRFVAI